MWKSKYMGLIIGITIFMLNLFDMSNTWYLITTECVPEMNPYMDMLIECGWGWFFLVKISSGLIAFFAITVCWEDYKLARYGGILVVIIYVGVTIWHLYNIMSC